MPWPWTPSRAASGSRPWPAAIVGRRCCDADAAPKAELADDVEADASVVLGAPCSGEASRAHGQTTSLEQLGAGEPVCKGLEERRPREDGP